MSIGIVVIARNEGERLAACLQSLPGREAQTVYVDSGSTDGSVALARARGIDVLELDPSTAFTAARARNEGFRRLTSRDPGIEFVQFLDGDCELAAGWLDKGAAFLRERDGVAVVCGRLREKHPERSVYNLLCDIEWDTPLGESRACGGVAMVRASAFAGMSGFNADLIAGEEPELCVRLRAAQWSIWCLSEEMAVHDAAMSRFGQWWTRALRCGFAFAQGAALHGGSPARHFVRESLSAWFWGLGVPLATVALAAWQGGWALLLLLIYPLQVARLALRAGRGARESWLHAGFLMLGKFPEMLGQVKFLFGSMAGGQARLIEYK